MGARANNDALQFSLADFSYFSGTDGATDLAALIVHNAVTPMGANTKIADTHDDVRATNFAFK